MYGGDSDRPSARGYEARDEQRDGIFVFDGAVAGGYEVDVEVPQGQDGVENGEDDGCGSGGRVEIQFDVVGGGGGVRHGCLGLGF